MNLSHRRICTLPNLLARSVLTQGGVLVARGGGLGYAERFGHLLDLEAEGQRMGK